MSDTLTDPPETREEALSRIAFILKQNKETPAAYMMGLTAEGPIIGTEAAYHIDWLCATLFRLLDKDCSTCRYLRDDDGVFVCKNLNICFYWEDAPKAFYCADHEIPQVEREE